MSVLTGIGGLLRQVAAHVVQTGRELIRVTAPKARAIKEKVREYVDEFTRRTRRAFRRPPASERDFVERQLADVNDRVMVLKRLHERRGLRDSEVAEWRRLKAKRQELRSELESLDGEDLVADIVDEDQAFEPVTVDDENAHLIDMVVGKSTYGKDCRICRRAMILQWDRRVETPRLSDFFWGCSGWYILLGPDRHACYYKEGLLPADYDIFANMRRPEFAGTARDLSKLVLDPGKRSRIRAALDSIRDAHKRDRKGLAHYRCPVHGETLRLRRKRQADDSLLDEYFLGCPRWLPDHAGCNFLIKLKSPARISAALEAGLGDGAVLTLQ